MTFRYKWFAEFAEPPTVPLIRHGRGLRANLRRELLTEEELQANCERTGLRILRT